MEGNVGGGQFRLLLVDLHLVFGNYWLVLPWQVLQDLRPSTCLSMIELQEYFTIPYELVLVELACLAHFKNRGEG